MRIGIDMYPATAPETTTRGIGKFTMNFAEAMITNHRNDEFILYVRHSEDMPCASHAAVGVSPFESLCLSNPNVSVCRYEENEKDKQRSLDMITNNRDNLDWLIVTSPHQSHVTLPGKIPHVASILYDMIPLRYPDIYLNDTGLTLYKERFNKYISAIKKYHALLSISQATADDAVDLANLDREKIHVIHCGVDKRFRARGLMWIYPQWLKEITEGFPYVLHVGGMDSRKGGHELIDAWHMLPARIKSFFHLIYAYEMDSHYVFEIRKYSNLQGLQAKFHPLGFVSDVRLLDLYQNARVMCFPSKWEGFGLPILESLTCGVPVIAGSNSSQPYVLGDGGMLVNSSKPDDIAKCLEYLLDNTDLRERLSRRALIQASQPEFQWPNIAASTRQILKDITESARPETRKSGGRKTYQKPKMAFFGLVPPTLSGITPISLRLAQALAEHYAITFYHDPKVTPSFGKSVLPFTDILPATMYNGCPRLLWQFGNSVHHEWMLPILFRRGGVVTLHDANLKGLSDYLKETHHPLSKTIHEWPDLINEMHESGCKIVVNSKDAAGFVRLYSAGQEDAIIPLGMDINTLDGDTIRKRRKELGWENPNWNEDSKDIIYMGTGGFIHESKMPDVLIGAYVIARRTLMDLYNKRLVLVFIGKELDELARRVVTNMSVPDVLWTGEIPENQFANTIACLDICVQLRKLPGNGETSGALLDAIRSGVACIVSNCGSFKEFPEFVKKVDIDASASMFLAYEITKLIIDPADRFSRSGQGIAWAQAERRWADVAERYAEVIERYIAPQVAAEVRTLG